ncbi:MAG: alkaline phosphatase family protein, partial [Candidatus Saccharicenans sp.]|nr:alkaline phosphatase family protein [Candidatus Saccharicenans sp.]
IQHMFWRYLDKTHPAYQPTARLAEGARVLPDLYRRMDDLVGKVLSQMGERSALFIMSDHGFKPFRRGVNLNSWLYLNGYLQLKDGASESQEWFRQVDWSRTRAYALGLAGIYLNRKGREAQGTVEPGEESRRLKQDLIEKLSGLKDPEKGAVAINRLIDTEKIYNGPYRDNAPDLIVAYNQGYRASWDSVVGKVNRVIIEDNRRAWSADHCLDPALVPGVLFSNLKLEAEEASIMDLAPTVLELFGLKAPSYMDGQSLLRSESGKIKMDKPGGPKIKVKTDDRKKK